MRSKPLPTRNVTPLAANKLLTASSINPIITVPSTNLKAPHVSKLNKVTPVGRLVQGDPFAPQTKDKMGNPLTVKTGPNKGQPAQQFFVAIAVPKNDPQWPAWKAEFDAKCRQDWPQWFDAAGNCTHPRFSSKIIDGDGIDDNGKRNAEKEGFAGHWVIRLSSGFAPAIYEHGKYPPTYPPITDPARVKRGYYVRASCSIEGNGNAEKPGMYVNLNMLELVGFGPEIISGPDASEVFASPVALPVGASAVPVVGTGAPAPALVMPAAPAMAPAAPPVAVAPNPAFVPVAPPAMPAPPVGPQLTPAGVATGFTYQQYIASGWTDGALRAAGYLA